MEKIHQLKAIETVEDLYLYLHTAMQLEHATIPPYLTALYSIHPYTNKDATDVLRVVVVEEMLHLTLAANLLNAIGGKPDLTVKRFVPDYPACLPDGEHDFEVGIGKFSKETLNGFLMIERPNPPAHDSIETGLKTRGLRKGGKKNAMIPTYKGDGDDEYHFPTIGLFYAAIGEGLERLAKKIGEEKLFCGDASRQVTPEFYYSGGGELTAVTDLNTAKEAIRLISEQGEGFGDLIYDNEGEISHYYRFQQLYLGKYYQQGDTAFDEHKPGSGPSGPAVEVDWDAVYPVFTNLKLKNIPKDSELYQAAVSFNTFYKAFLVQLTEAFNGEPQKLLSAVGNMFKIKELAYQLIKSPIPGKNANAAPTFEVDLV